MANRFCTRHGDKWLHAIFRSVLQISTKLALLQLVLLKSYCLFGNDEGNLKLRLHLNSSTKVGKERSGILTGFGRITIAWFLNSSHSDDKQDLPYMKCI